MERLKSIDEIKNIVANNKMSLLYISSESCNVCKIIFPKVEEMLKAYPAVKAARADIDEMPALSGEYSVFTIPCILVFAEEKEVIREARYINIESIEERIKRYYRMIY
jgi:thiol-disulfide isomerase/thioredoxin